MITDGTSPVPTEVSISNVKVGDPVRVDGVSCRPNSDEANEEGESEEGGFKRFSMRSGLK